VFCGSCGAKLTEDLKFCRSCGAPVTPESSEETAATAVNWPSNGDTLVAPAPLPPPVIPQPQYAPPPPAASAQASSRSEQPSWLIPVIVGGALIVLGAIAAVVFFAFSGRSSPDPLSQQAVPLLAPVNADVSSLSDDLSGTLTASELSGVQSDASRVGSSATSAATGIQGLKLKPSDQTAADQLVSALQATAIYGHSVAAAAKSPTTDTVARAQADATATKTSYAAVATSVPALAIPSSGEFSVASLASYVTKQQAAAHKAASGKASAHDYVSRIDSLLSNSADTRGDLGQLIVGIENGSLTAPEAKSQIAAILNQRQDLQNSISLVNAPGPFAHVQALLRSSLTAAIADDTAIQGWIDAWDTGDNYGINQFWNQHLDATARATAAKNAFVQAYNQARARTLHLGPSPTGSNY
jgi:hypothetical protein